MELSICTTDESRTNLGSPGREIMIPYQMILLNCIGCQLSKGLISKSWSLHIRLSTINHLITSPACSNYGLIPGTSAPHLLHLNLFSLELIITRSPIVSFHVMHLVPCKWNQLPRTSNQKCYIIPLQSSKDFWNFITCLWIVLVFLFIVPKRLSTNSLV